MKITGGGDETVPSSYSCTNAACRQYISERCSFQYHVATDAKGARDLENRLKRSLKPALNP